MQINNLDKIRGKKQRTVLLGMSGGVDSSLAALILQKQGYKVTGAFMKNFSKTKNKITGECTWVEDRREAQKIASLLGIELITLDYEREYKKSVLDPMFRSYASGKTPNPDILCNAIIKFPFLWKEARKRKIEYISTGHYARIRKTPGGYQLLAGRDKNKDQSYFLANLTQKDLSHTLFPIGNYNKLFVRETARKQRFPNWNRLGTRGICFVGKQNMISFLGQRIKSELGKVTSPDGKIVGTHRGAAYYTIGQKAHESIGIQVKKPAHLAQKRFYIAEKRGNTLIAAPEGHSCLKKKKVHLIKFRKINPKEKMPFNLKARFRHLGRLHEGGLIKKRNRFFFVFKKSQEAVAEGQFLVLYYKDRVIASGEIRI